MDCAWGYMETRARPERPLPSEVLAILRCPVCKSELSRQGGALLCTACGRSFPSVRGVVRFVDTQAYAGSFGYQWHKHARTQLDGEESRSSEVMFHHKTGFTADELCGKLVLDVGCGMGRFADVASRWGARVVGVDLSNATEAASDNLGDRDSVTILQADVFALPFRPQSFDYIYSIGVLHHTPDCEAAFKQLPRLLKPGGGIAIWLYSGYNKWYRFSDLYRRMTHRLPATWLHALCYFAVPLFYVHRGLRRVPLIGRAASELLHHILPFSTHPQADARVLDTFDWYSPKFQSKHTYEQVFRWFEACGLDCLRVLDVPVSVRGRKPKDPEESCV